LHHAIFSQLMQKCIEQFAQKMSNLQFFIDWWYWWFLGLAGIVFPIGALLCLNRASAKVFVCCSWAMLLLRVLNYSFCYGRVWLRFAVYFFLGPNNLETQRNFTKCILFCCDPHLDFCASDFSTGVPSQDDQWGRVFFVCPCCSPLLWSHHRI
jgi:hypothetical protein